MLSFLFHQTFFIKINVPETNEPGSQITTSNHSDGHLPSNCFYEFPLCHSEPTTASTHGRHFKVAMIHPTGSRELTQLFHTGERGRDPTHYTSRFSVGCLTHLVSVQYYVSVHLKFTKPGESLLAGNNTEWNREVVWWELCHFFSMTMKFSSERSGCLTWKKKYGP